MREELGVVIRMDDGSIVKVMQGGSCSECELQGAKGCTGKRFTCSSLQKSFDVEGIYMVKV